jgi:hypothetical protein
MPGYQLAFTDQRRQLVNIEEPPVWEVQHVQ